MAIAPGMSYDFQESCHIANLLLHRSGFLTFALNGCLTRAAVLPIYVLVIDQFMTGGTLCCR